MTEEHKITLTYLNIRQSIAILLAKLVLTDILFASVVIVLYFTLVRGEALLGVSFINPPLFLISFAVIGIIKIIITTYVVLKWLNEYYEITPEVVIHKSGLIFRKTEQYDLDKVRMMDIGDTFLGELFNFATITLYDIRLNKYLSMYLIHDPERYAHVLNILLPHIEIKKDKVRLPFMPKRQNGYI